MDAARRQLALSPVLLAHAPVLVVIGMWKGQALGAAISVALSCRSPPEPSPA